MASSEKGLEQRVDLRLGQLAVRQGKISSAQLQEALDEQVAGVKRGRKKPRRLGVILAEKKFLTFEAVQALLEEQEARLLAEDRRRREDVFLGRILVDAALVDAARVEECLQLQILSLEKGAESTPFLGQLLIEKGYATSAEIDQALELQRQVRLSCGACGKEFGIDALQIETPDRCPECGGSLEAISPESEPEPARLPEPSPPPLPEDLLKLGRYCELRRIGQGAMGAVYEAIDPQLNRKVALKVLRSDLETADGADEAEVKRFIREAQLAANLPKHPNIVAVYEAGLQEGRHFIAMEFIQGQTFSQWRRKGVALRKQIRALRDVSLAVHHAHGHGVLHRDLKPGNILVDSEGKPFVVDFGLARPVAPGSNDSSGTHRISGTPAYMSPEQASGVQLDARCDVFSLGAVLYEVLTGRPPFHGRNRQEVFQKLLSDAPAAPIAAGSRLRPFSSVDTAIERVCLKALERDRAARTASAKEFAKGLSAWLESAEKTKTGRELAAGHRWRRPALLAAGGAALLLGLVLVLPLFGKKPPTFEKDLQEAASRAGAGETEMALKFYEEILRRDPANKKAREGRDQMRSRRVTEAGKAVDEAYSNLERARTEAAEKAKAIQRATLANEQELRDREEAARARLKTAEELLRKARERLKQVTEGQAPAAPQSP